MLVATRFLFLCAALLIRLPIATAAPPTAPADMTVGAISTTAIKVIWSDRSTNETGFEVFNGNEIRRVSAGATNYVWNGLTPAQWMCFRTRSFNNSGASPWVPTAPPYYLCALTPNSLTELLAFPISGKSNIGSYGLHDDNFSGIVDDKTNNVYGFNKSGTGNNYSLDFIAPGTTPVRSVRGGTVLAVQRQCEVVVVDSNDLWFVYVHIIPSNSLRSGQPVGRGSLLGTVNPQKHLTKQPPCNLFSDTPHVHLAVALPPPPGGKATYVTLQDRYFCGHRVIKINNDNSNIILDGLTQDRMQRFTVPQCWASAGSVPASPSNISVFMTSGGAGIGVTWRDNSNNEDGFNIVYSPTKDTGNAKHDLVEPNQTFISSDWGLAYNNNGLLVSGQKMCFQVIAYNANGNSAPTPWGCITVP